MSRKRVLIFNGYYTPARNYGGPLTSCRNVVNTCSDEFEFFIIARNHDVGSTKVFPNLHKGWGCVDGVQVRYIADGELNYDRKGIHELLIEIHPDLIWFAGILVPKIKLITLLEARKMHIPVLISPRGEVSEDRIGIKAWKKKPYLFITQLLGFYKDVWFHATSTEEITGLQKYVKAEKERIFLVPNIGVPLAEPRYDYQKEVGVLRVVFIARIHSVKNLKVAVEAVCKMKSNVTFDVYGPLEQPEYWNECMMIYKSAPSNVKVNYCGQIEPTKVGCYFRQYDCFLFPTINENYGHSIAEALANGVPVILSKGTTPWDSVHEKAGYVCPQDNIGTFIDALEFMAKMNDEEYRVLHAKVRDYYRAVIIKDDSVVGHKNMFNSIIGKLQE